MVAPVRERGLKLRPPCIYLKKLIRRSREGAWIEIARIPVDFCGRFRRSREGAWIEIPVRRAMMTTAAGRSRERAWIEIL